MKVKEYNVVEKCIENGVEFGYNRAFKHTDTPDADKIKNEIVSAILHEMCEWFEFDNGEEEN